MAGVSCHETEIGALLPARLDPHLVLVQSLRIDRASSVRLNGVLLEPKSMDEKCHARTRARHVLPPTLGDGGDDVLKKYNRQKTLDP